MFYVKFTDESQVAIGSVFCGPQDSEAHENMGVVERDDDRLIEFWASLPQDILIAL